MASNNSEDPHVYLEEGTEVSAKFKGAFCEAKITKVDKIVKCKLTLKNSNESLTVNYNQILSSTGQTVPTNELKQGNIVFINKSQLDSSNSNSTSLNNLQEATLNKIIDQSVYTVIFNDGDEKNLKRSFIRFKGEKHYLDSETLNNAPLNNPEHFLYPIKNSSKLSPTSSLANQSLEGKRSNNTQPGLNTSSSNVNNTQSGSENESDLESVSNTTCTSLSLSKNAKNRNDDETTSKNSKNYDANEDDKEEKFTNKNEDDYNDETIDNENEDDVDEDGEEDSSSTTSSDDYPPEEKDRFVAQLYKFMDDRGTPMNKVPCVNKIDLDLHKFFIVVRKFGGFNKVTKQRCWSDVYKRLGLPNPNSSNIINLKCSYKRYLHPYEDFYRKLGSTMCDLVSLRQTSSNSSSKRSIRSESNRLFKSRYISPASATQQKKPLSKYKQKLLASSSASTDSKENTTEASPLDSKTNNQLPSSSVASTDLPSLNTIETQKKRSLSANESIEENANDSNQEKEITIESIASLYSNTMLSSSMTSNVPNDDQSQQPQEELTLSGMFKDLNENLKKAKKQEKEKKLIEEISIESPTQSKKANEKLSSIKCELVKEDNKPTKVNTVGNLKRPSSATLTTSHKTKGRRSSVDKTSQLPKKSKTEPIIHSEYDEEDEEEEEEEDEPKPKKKPSRLSLDQSDDSSSAKNGRAVKRKSSLSSNSKTVSNNEDESENEKEKHSNNKSNEIDGKKIYTSSDIELSKIVEVRYGSGKTTYHAKIVQINEENQTMRVHYLGWNNRYDEWIKIDKIIKIFSDDYGANKRRKATKSTNLTHQLSASSNETHSPTLPQPNDVFLISNQPANSKESNNKSKNSSTDTNESLKSSTKIPKTGKRSSLSSTSSSSSSNDQAAIPKDEPSLPDTNKSQNKTIEIKNEPKSLLKALSGKKRSSDSISSNSSTELQALNSSMSSSASLGSSLSSTDNSTQLKKTSSVESSSKESSTVVIKEDKDTEDKIKKELEIKENDEQCPDNELKKSTTSSTNSNTNPLLSIKEEIIDFEAATNITPTKTEPTIANSATKLTIANSDSQPTSLPNQSKTKLKPTPSIETVNFVNSIVLDLVNTAFDQIEEKLKTKNAEVSIVKQNSDKEQDEIPEKLSSNSENNNSKLSTTTINSDLKPDNDSNLESSNKCHLSPDKKLNGKSMNENNSNKNNNNQRCSNIKNSDPKTSNKTSNKKENLCEVNSNTTNDSTTLNGKSTNKTKQTDESLTNKTNKPANTNEIVESQSNIEQSTTNINGNMGKNKEVSEIKNQVENNSNSKEEIKQSNLCEEFKENNQTSFEVFSKSTNLKTINESSISSTNQVNNQIINHSDDKDKECLTMLTNTQKPIQNPAPEYKYPFHLIGCKYVGKQKIRFIEEQMRLCREEYAKLKNEIAAIDRKKKKLKRNLLEKSSSNSNNTNLNSNNNNITSNNEETLNLSTPKIESNRKN